MDAGPIWGTRTFPIDGDPPPKSSLYNGPVADAALELIGEVVQQGRRPGVRARAVGLRAGRRDRLAAAGDASGGSRSSPGRTTRRRSCAGSALPTDPRVCARRSATFRSPVFDAHAGPALHGEPGRIARRHHDAVLVHTGDGSVWIGQVRIVDRGVKLPAAMALASHLGRVPEVLQPLEQAAHEASEAEGRREIGYRRDGDVGVLSFDFYNGAMSTGQCRRLTVGPAPRRRPGHEGAGDPRRRRVLQRHPPQRHPRGGLPGDGGVAQHQRDRRRLPGDHHLHRPARRHVDRAAAPAPAA